MSLLKHDLNDKTNSNEKLKEEIGEALTKSVILKLIIIRTIKSTFLQNNLNNYPKLNVHKKTNINVGVNNYFFP